MSTIRELDLANDLPMLRKWWELHKAVPCPESFLPQGFLISAGGVDVAAAFLYMDVGGKLAMIEYLTTNPSVAFSRYLVEDVKALIAHVEAVAVKQGCTGIISMVAPETGEFRLMQRMGYLPPDVGAKPHVMFCKRLVKEEGKCP